LKGAWLPLRLTAVFLLLDNVPVWYLAALTITLAGAGLVFPVLLRIPALWLGVAFVFLAWILRLWPLVDNHQYLAGYWALAIFLALCLTEPQASLATSARWLLALVFLWAALWKGVLSPDYMDGRFFTARLMTDPRFEEQAVLLSGLSVQEVRQNRAYLSPDFSADGREQDLGDAQTTISEMHTTPRFRFWVRVITWMVMGFEAVLGLAFLLPGGGRIRIPRDVGLMAFCIGTFAFAPVRSFGWVLAILGLAQTPRESVRLRAAYVIVWFLIGFISSAPWSHVTGLIG
jgi:hypothetical protein